MEERGREAAATTTEHNMNITTTLQQLTNARNPLNRLSAMIGASAFIDHGEAHAVSFKFKGCRTFNYCKITLDASDTYTVTLMKVSKWGDIKKTQEAAGLYSDHLKSHFETKTGLYLSM
jgi:hypothetical protein